MLVIGNSHPECAIIDSLIPKIYNISHSGESFVFSYMKAKKIIEENPSIKTLFIEFGGRSLCESKQNTIWGRKLKWRFSRFAPFMSFDEFFLFTAHNPLVVLSEIKTTITENELFLKSNSKDFIGYSHMGGHKYLHESQLLKDIKKKKKPFKLKKLDHDIEYLDELLLFCKKNNIRPIFIRCPVHPLFGIWKVENSYQDFIKRRYSSIDFMDFAKFKVRDEDFFDLSHLNTSGGIKFTKFFDELINSGILESKKKVHFVYSE